MPARRSKPLTATAIKNAKPHPDGRAKQYPDGQHGLELYVFWRKDGRVGKRWRQRVPLPNGKPTYLGLGPWPEVSLAAAREEALDNLQRLRRGEDVRKQQPAAAVTFAEAWQALYDKMKPTWMHPKTARQWQQRHDAYMAHLDKVPVSQIALDDIVGALEPIWATKHAAARSVLRELFAVLEDSLESLPTSKEIARRRLGRQPRRETQHFAAVTPKALPAAVAAIAAADASSRDRLALLFTILTASRQTETRSAEWSQMTEECSAESSQETMKLWVLPGERMKAGRTHRVPITAAVDDLLAAAAALQAAAGDSGAGYVFAGSGPSGKMSETAMSKLVKACDLTDGDRKPATVHGFRSTFTDWATETGDYDVELVEMALAHTPANKVRAAYRRSLRLDERHAMLTAWAAHCLSAVDPEAMWAQLSG